MRSYIFVDWTILCSAKESKSGTVVVANTQTAKKRTMQEKNPAQRRSLRFRPILTMTSFLRYSTIIDMRHVLSKEISDLLERNVEAVISKENLEKKLRSGKKLRVKLGIDVTSPDIHIGRAPPQQAVLYGIEPDRAPRAPEPLHGVGVSGCGCAYLGFETILPGPGSLRRDGARPEHQECQREQEMAIHRVRYSARYWRREVRRTSNATG